MIHVFQTENVCTGPNIFFSFKTNILIQDCASVKCMQTKSLELPPEGHGSLSRSSGGRQRGTEAVKGLEIDLLQCEGKTRHRSFNSNGD